MADFTPGPYTTRDTQDSGTEISSENFDGRVIATVYPRGSWHTAHLADQDTDPVQEANARLLASAPELLAALTAQRCFDCQQWLEIVERRTPRLHCDRCELAMAAIAKALGLGSPPWR